MEIKIYILAQVNDMCKKLKVKNIYLIIQEKKIRKYMKQDQFI